MASATSSPRSASWLHLETTTTAAGVGIRATVESVWSPTRAAASYAKDVRSIDVRRTTSRYGRVHDDPPRLDDHRPDTVAEVVSVFNRLPGRRSLVFNCPMIRKTVDYRVVFHSSHGDLVANAHTGCGAGVSVSRNGTQLPPALDDPDSLIKPSTRPADGPAFAM